jgi:hypothetical protein
MVGGSSRRWKREIGDITDPTLNPHILYDIPIHQFKFTEDYAKPGSKKYDKNIIGFIAEELEEIYPVSVEYEEGGDEIVGWNPKYMVPPMLSLIQEQHKQIEELQSQINELKEKING